jgi:hypothetical protein
MPAAKFTEIKEKLQIQDDEIFFYTVESNGVIKLQKITEYELLAEEGLKEVYDFEPEGLWEKCLES